MTLTRRLLLSVALMALTAGGIKAAEKPKKVKVFRWTDIGGDPLVKGRAPVAEDMRKGLTHLLEAAKRLPEEKRPSPEAIRAFDAEIPNLTFNPKHPFVWRVKEGEEHLIMIGAGGKAYIYVVTVPSRWKKDRSRFYYRIVHIHEDLRVEEWRVYQGCANLTYSQFEAGSTACIPHGPRIETELTS